MQTASSVSTSAVPAAAGQVSVIDRLARGSVLAFGLYLTGAAITYVAQLLVARWVGSTSYGYYAYALAWMTTLAYVAALGFDVSLLRLLPAYCALGQWHLARGVLQYAERRITAAGVAIMIVGGLVLWRLSHSHPAEQLRTFAVGLILVPVWSLLWMSSSAVRAFGGVFSAVAPDRIVRDGGLMLIIALLTFVDGARFDASGVMLTSVLCSFTGLIIVRIALSQLRPRAVTHATPEYLKAIWRLTALPLVLINVAEALMNRTGTVLLGGAGQTIDAGIYALTFNVAMTVMLPRTAVNALFAPLVSELSTRGDRHQLQAVVTRSALWTLLSSVCIALPIMALAEPLLSWFGPDFVRGATPLRVLLVGQVIASGFGPQMFLMTMTGNERMAATLLVGSAAVNAVLAAILIEHMGLTGAAIATTAALIVWNLAMAIFVWCRLGLAPGLTAHIGVRGRAAKRLV